MVVAGVLAVTGCEDAVCGGRMATLSDVIRLMLHLFAALIHSVVCCRMESLVSHVDCAALLRVVTCLGFRGRVWLLVVMPYWRISLNWVAVGLHMVVAPVVVAVLLQAVIIEIAAVAEIP